MKKSKGRPRRSPLAAAADAFDLPAQVAAGDTRLTITGRRRLLVENHRGIAAYAPEEIDVACRDCTLSVLGRDLCLTAMNRRELLLEGELLGLQFSAGKGSLL